MACNDRGDEEALTEGASTDDDIRDLQRRQKDTAMPLNAEDGPGEFFLPQLALPVSANFPSALQSSLPSICPSQCFLRR